MITLRNLTLARGARILAAGIDLTIHQGQRIGIVGANGCGKSTLLALLAGDLHADAGNLEMPSRLRIARVMQETPAVDRAAIDYVLDGDTELREIECSLAKAQAEHRAETIAVLHEQLELIGGYTALSRAASLLHGLGFTSDEHRAPVSSFSGGWRMRLNLARALIARADLLLLDEPTNHLDLDAVMWLERWLSAYRGTLLLVSHDREFLDAVTRRILHFESQSIVAYGGNYSAFEVARAQALAAQQAMYARQQREIMHLQAFVDRFRAKATKARQAQSRLKALSRMERIASAHVDTPFTFRFEPPLAVPNPLVALDQAEVRYGERLVLKVAALSLLAGSRIGLLGRNGAGKSTLIKALAGEVALSGGERREGRGLAIGYFAQHQLEQLRPDETPLQHLARAEPSAREQDLRDFLGSFGFGDQALAQVGPMSGGERARLALALVVRRRPNLLLLDEPTNHLDIEMCHALTLALQEYEGAVVVVSHDRHMLRTTVDDFWLVADGGVREFDGDLEDYRSWLLGSDADRVATPGEGARSTRRDERRDRARRQDALAAKRRPLEREIRQLEVALQALGSERDSIDLALTEGPSGGDTIAVMQKRRALIESRIAASESRWYELQEALAVVEKS